jgi:DNA-binding transcriptional regulator YhcF (GntR family)
LPGLTCQLRDLRDLRGLDFSFSAAPRRIKIPLMQFWFARGSNVTIREQLVTQIILGILSDDLAPGQRLPSTRELARRFRVHSNTVSGGYRQLEREQWVEFRHGSGVYVRDTRPEVSDSAALALDQMIGRFFRSARDLNTPLATVRTRLRHWLELQPPDHFLLVEPDEELREILSEELRQAVNFPVLSCGVREVSKLLEGSTVISLPNRTASIRPLLPSGADLLTLQVRSVPTSLAPWLPAPISVLIGVASRWPKFLKTARTILLAANFAPDSLVFRDRRKASWRRGLDQTVAVVCDIVTAAELPSSCRAIPFPLISESSIAELQRYVEFIRSPLTT